MTTLHSRNTLRHTPTLPRARSPRILPLPAALLLLLAAGTLPAALTACGKSDDAAAAASSADRTAARVQTFSITTVALGELESRNAIEIRNKVETRTDIVEIVPEGVHVTKGDVLVKLNSDSLETQIQEETLRVESARADKIAADNALLIQESDNASKLSTARLNLELAELSLQQWIEGDVKTREQALLLELERSQREVDRLTDRVKRSQDLYKNNFLSKDELDRDELQLVQAQADLAQAGLDKQVYEDFQKPKEEKQKRSDVEQAKAEVDRVELNNKKELATKQAAANNMREQLKVREQRLAKYSEQLAATIVRAPADGLVVYSTSMARGRGDRFQNSGPLQVGREVVNNEMLISLPDTSVMQASVQVHESLAGRIRQGMPATIKIDALPGLTFSGQVDSVGIMAEQTNWRDPNLREYTVKVTLDPSPAASQLKPSMRAEARIEIGHVQDALSVPIQSIFSDGPVRFVYISDATRFVRRPVSVGRRSDTLAEITAGLSAGEVVLVRDPAPGEVVDQPWDKDQLIAAGYTIGDNGQPVANIPDSQVFRAPGTPPSPGAPGSPGSPGSPGANAQGRGQPGAQAPGAGGERRRGPRGNGNSDAAGKQDRSGKPNQDDNSSEAKPADGDTAKPAEGGGARPAAADGAKPAESREKPAAEKPAAGPASEKPAASTGAEHK